MVSMMDKLYKIAEGLNIRFPDGNDPFVIVTRLAEECGEVAAEVNHFEGQGVKAEKSGPPDRKKFAKELQDVIRAVLHLVLYYDLQTEMAELVDEYYRRVVDEGLVEPLANEKAHSGGA
jgi:NTP pyrophosphatase (non-canonical NTP hydrolase)